ncbi:MAG: response regulator transcription factor [Chloroflexi bacterium]|nr:response regulator transcription factor [Chloroflexota bacterium]
MTKIRIVIADDHAMVREGIRMILAAQPDIEVVGEAADGKQAVEQVRLLMPDIALMDVAMPGLGGLEAALEIRKLAARTRILVLSQYDNKEYIFRLLKAGASGYVLKSAAGKELVNAIRAVQEGGSFLDPSITSAVIEGYVKSTVMASSAYEDLSDREKQVLKLIAEGYTSKQIADTLCISVKTVMAHRTNIMDKLNIHNRAELIKYAITKGLITVPHQP